MRHQSELISKRINKLAQLSEGQDRPLRNGSQHNVVALDGVQLPKCALYVSSLVSLRLVSDKRSCEVQIFSLIRKMPEPLHKLPFSRKASKQPPSTLKPCTPIYP